MRIINRKYSGCQIVRISESNPGAPKKLIFGGPTASLINNNQT